VTVLDAGLVEGETKGGREDMEQALETLRHAGGSAYLHAWKPWG
jgi:hypothetical protein